MNEIVSLPSHVKWHQEEAIIIRDGSSWSPAVLMACISSVLGTWSMSGEVCPAAGAVLPATGAPKARKSLPKGIKIDSKQVQKGTQRVPH